MNKKGFVFVESIVVLVVVALSLAMMISSYSLVSRKSKEKEYYNKSSDKYLIYALSSVGTDDVCNYGIKCNDEETINFHATPYNCDTTKLGRLMYNCQEVFSELDVSDIYVVDDITNILRNNYNDKDEEGNQYYKNGVIEYMKTLKKCKDINTSKEANITDKSEANKCENPIRYMIGVFNKGNDKYYYAAIEL